jgi:hypothetical protein
LILSFLLIFFRGGKIQSGQNEVSNLEGRGEVYKMNATSTREMDKMLHEMKV